MTFELRSMLQDRIERARWRIFMISERVKKTLGIETEIVGVGRTLAKAASEPEVKAFIIQFFLEPPEPPPEADPDHADR